MHSLHSKHSTFAIIFDVLTYFRNRKVDSARDPTFVGPYQNVQGYTFVIEGNNRLKM